MARHEKNRKICNPPLMIGFMPFGLTNCETEILRISFEQYESIKLVDYKMLSHSEAALTMNVSRPTFTRIYNKAKKIIAKAFVEGKAIEISGGNFALENEWFRCKKCFKLIEGIENHFKCDSCECFENDELIKLTK